MAICSKDRKYFDKTKIVPLWLIFRNSLAKNCQYSEPIAIFDLDQKIDSLRRLINSLYRLIKVENMQSVQKDHNYFHF